MGTTTCMRRTLWGIAVLAALAAPTSPAEATTQEERDEVERTVVRRIEIGGVTPRDRRLGA